MNNLIKLIISFCIIILISNFVKIPTIGKSYSYQTENKEFAYRCVPSKGTKEVDMFRAFERFKTDNPEFQDLILYRTFRKEWWKFWNWNEYMFSKWWKYPFIESN